MYENAFQKVGKELTGHTHPLTKRQMDDMKSNTTKPFPCGVRIY